MVSMFGLAYLIITFNDIAYSPDDIAKLTQGECILLASVLCATDTVAALAIVKEKDFPTLNSILFGEGVVNDAVSILLYRAIEKLIESMSGDEFALTWGDVGNTFLQFLYLSAVSVLIGIGYGLLASFMLKRVPSMKEHPVREICIVILVAYLAYITAEATEMSGIMTIFCVGFTLSHYAFYNISPESQKGSVLAINTIAHAAEAFLFAYLGLAVYAVDEESFSLVFAIMVIAAGAIARLVSVVVTTLLFMICKRGKLAIDAK